MVQREKERFNVGYSVNIPSKCIDDIIQSLHSGFIQIMNMSKSRLYKSNDKHSKLPCPCQFFPGCPTARPPLWRTDISVPALCQKHLQHCSSPSSLPPFSLFSHLPTLVEISRTLARTSARAAVSTPSNIASPI